MIGLVDNCVFVAVSGGTGDFHVSAAATGYQTPAQTGQVTDTITYRYRAESSDKSQWEIGDAVSSSGGTVFPRTVIKSSNANAAVNFSNPPNVALTVRAADIVQFYTQDTAPTGAPANSMWWNSATGALYVNYNDGTSTQWVSAAPQVASPAAVQYDVAQTLTTAQQAQARQNIAADYAVKADQQTGTATSKVISPAHQQDHPSAAKAWVYFTWNGTVVAIQDSFNVASVVRAGVGSFDITFTVPFATANYAVFVQPESHTINMSATTDPANRAAGSMRIFTVNDSTGVISDPGGANASFFGKQ